MKCTECRVLQGDFYARCVGGKEWKLFSNGINYHGLISFEIINFAREDNVDKKCPEKPREMLIKMTRNTWSVKPTRGEHALASTLVGAVAAGRDGTGRGRTTYVGTRRVVVLSGCRRKGGRQRRYEWNAPRSFYIDQNARL